MVFVEVGAALGETFNDVEPEDFGSPHGVAADVTDRMGLPIYGWFRSDSAPMAQFMQYRAKDAALREEAFSGEKDHPLWGQAYWDDDHVRYFEGNFHNVIPGVYHFDHLDAAFCRPDGWLYNKGVAMRQHEDKVIKETRDLENGIVGLDHHPMCIHCYRVYTKQGDPNGIPPVYYEHGVRGVYQYDPCFLCERSDDILGSVQLTVPHIQQIKKLHHDIFLDSGIVGFLGFRRVMYENDITAKHIYKSFAKFLFSRPYREMFMNQKMAKKKLALKQEWPFNSI